MRFAASLLLVAGILGTRPTFADGSLFGTISGKVKDESGGALPGVAIEVTSSEKGFKRTATTDAAGAFTIALLPPGTYRVTAMIQGFESYVSSGDVVTAEKTTTVAISLKLAQARESVEVIAQTPLIDRTNTTNTTTVSAELTDKLPVVRGYQNVIDFAPGQNDIDGDGNPNARGAPDSGNVFLFDGVDTTDPTTGTFGANNNFDTIQEVVVSNANISAEYGRVQGGVFNVITKSGGNTFHGSGRVLVTNDNWNADNKGINPISGAPFNRTKFDENIYDYLFTLGGPVWKDHIWFFGAFERNPQTTPEQQTQTSFLHPDGTGESYQRHRLYEAWQGKLSGQLTPSHALTFSAQADPFTGDVRDYWGAAADLESLTAQDQANNCPWACIWQARYTGIFGSNVAAEVTYAQQRGGISVGNFEGDGPPYINLSDGLTYNGGAFVGTVDRPRNQVNGAVSYFATIAEHSHNFKVGVDYQEIESVNDYAFPGNQLFFVTDYDPIAREPILSVGDQRLDFLPQAPSVSTGKIWGIYALDRFDLSSRLSFNLGLRADIQSAKSDAQRLTVDTTSIAPRLSVSWDVTGQGTTLLSAGYGRYYEFIAQSLVDAIFANNPQESQYDVYAWDGDSFEFAYPVRVFDQPVNPDLKASHVDEYNLALQHELGSAMAVSLRGVYRKWNDIIDDIKVLDADGNKILTPINFDSDIIDRQYKAVELSFTRRFSKNFQALVTYTLSSAKGNADRSYSLVAFTSQLLDYPNDSCTVPAVGDRPEISGPCPEILGHNHGGYLPWDVTNSVKLYTAYSIPFSFMTLTAAPSFTYFSGLTYQQQRSVVINGDQDLYYDTPQGSSRLKDWYQVNFSLEAGFRVFDPVEIAVKGDIFNVTNQQPTIDATRIVLTPTDLFGQPTTRTALNAPRAFQLSAVVRF
jgi:outer membrane receptor for ferrienterochelin and colicin